MSGYDELVGRLTARLQVDPELRLDVAQELRTHLEDAEAELRDAGLDAEQAATEAIKALGDEAELAEQLWQANRRRIRIRGVARWVARVALLPGAIFVIAVIAAGLGGGYYSAYREWNGILHGREPAGGPTAEGLPEPQRFILHGDPAAKTRLERAKSIADRWPEDPVFYGNYVVCLVTSEGYDDPDPDRLDEMLAVLDKGEQIDPDNAFYNFTKAAWLILTASDLTEDRSRTHEVTSRDGKARREHGWRVEVRDADRFERGLAELGRGLGKADFSGRSVDMLRVRLGLLPQPTRLSNHLRRIILQVSVLVPRYRTYRELARSVLAHAIDLAKTGQEKAAVERVKSVELMAVKLGARDGLIIGLLVAQAIRTECHAQAEQVYKRLGRAGQAKHAHEARKEEVAFFERILEGRGLDRDKIAHAGLLGAALTPSLPGYRADFEPLRSAEQVVATELGLLGLLAMLALFASLLGATALLNLLFRRRIGRICLLAIVVPLAGYALYAHVLTASDRVYGLNFTFGKTLLEFVAVTGLLSSLLLGLSYSAIRQRAKEIGLSAPPPMRGKGWFFGVVGVAGLAVVVYLAGWWAGPFKPPKDGPSDLAFAGMILAVPVFLCVVIIVWLEFMGVYLPKKYTRFRRTLCRSLMPILAAAVIVIGSFCGWGLARAERSAVERVTRSGTTDLLRSEIDNSDFRLLRDRFAAEHGRLVNEGSR